MSLPIENLLRHINIDFDFHVFDELGSTSTYLKEIHAKHGAVAIAETQTAGKGRMGRSFYSPKGSGIYLSAVFEPEYITLSSLAMITIYTAVKVSEALNEILGISPSIKWVNDIYYNDKKIVGILAESTFNSEKKQPDRIIIGIGINLFKPENDFPDEIRERAGFISENLDIIIKNELIAKIIELLYCGLGTIDEKTILSEYKKRLFILGHKINVINGSMIFEATAIDIDETGSLIIRRDNGKTEALNSGEVSIKL